MIQLSPHVETAYIDYVPLAGAEPPHIHEPEDDGESEDREAFAEILAGLLNKTGVTEAETALSEDVSGFGVSPLEVELAAEAQAPPDVMPKRSPLPETAETELLEAGLHKTEQELSGAEHADDGQNMFLAMEQLLNRAVIEDEPEAVDNIAGDFPAEMDFPAVSGEAVPVDAADAAETGNAFETGEQSAPPLQFANENPHIDKDKTKGKVQNSEAPAPAAQQAGENNETPDRISQKKPAAKEGQTKLEAAREKRRSASVEVRDLRGGNVQAAEGTKAGTQLRASAETRVQTDTGPREITLELRLPNQGQNAPAATTAWDAKAGQAVTDLLARELHQNFNNDIVRHASMALRDEGAGTIRLALKPETLGNVKIHLEMAENKITGLIVVESEEALRAFEREIHSLEQAFRDSGFEGANLEMSLAGDGGAERQWQETEASRFLSGQQAASRYDASIERAETPVIVDLYQRGTALINVFA